VAATGVNAHPVKPETNRASSDATRRSAASARLSPAPTAAPSMRAIVGTFRRPTRSNARYTAPNPS
jgi:hypothetical protein